MCDVALDRPTCSTGYMHTHTHTYTHTHTHTLTRTLTCTYTCTHTHSFSDASGRRFSIPTSSEHGSHSLLTIIPSHEGYGSTLYPSKPTSVETVILIPALTVKAHYQSIVGRSYSTHNAPPASSPRRSPAPMPTIPTHHQMLTSAQPVPNQEPFDDSKPALPVKKGILSVSAVVASLPEDIKLTPSLLEFIERVATPTIAATVVTSGSSSDSDVESGEEEGGVDHAPQQQTAESWPISFPVHVMHSGLPESAVDSLPHMPATLSR